MRIVRQTKTCGVMKYTRPRKKAIFVLGPILCSFFRFENTNEISTTITLADHEA